MHLLQSWQHSLAIFRPINFKKFIQAVSNTLFEMYTTWFKYWWWLIGLYLVGGLFIFRPLTNLSTPFLISGFFHSVYFWDTPELIASILLVLLYTTLFLSVHSKAKNYAYFFHYIPHTFCIALWFCIVSGLYKMYGRIVNSLFFDGGMAQSLPSLTLPILTVTIATISALFTLFLITSLLDQPSLSLKKAFTNAGSKLFYSIPSSCIVAALYAAAYFCVYYVIFILFARAILTSLANVNPAMAYFILDYAHMCFDLLVALPILVAIVTTFYYKQKS